MDGKSVKSKEDIRRMMRQVAAKMQTSAAAAASSAAASSASGGSQQADGGTDSVKGHPFARYNSLNQLTCILCGCPVKSSLLWRAHLASRQHRANSEALRSRGADRATDILSGAGLKRRLESAQQQLQHQRQEKQQSGGLGLAYSDDENDADGVGESSAAATAAAADTAAVKKPRQLLSSQASSSLLLRKRTYVASEQHSKSLRQPDQKHQQQQQLPEGFFDDPVADARARNVPYKDKMEEELELFAREMRDTQAESEQMAEAAEEEADNVRYLEEIIAQEETWHRLNELEILKETAAVKQELLSGGVKPEPGQKDGGGDGAGASDEIEADELDSELDWRRKRL